MLNEAAFHLNSSVNKYNARYWSEGNPRITIETVMQPAKAHVCCSMSESHMIGPCFFDDNTIAGQSSHSMFKEVFVPGLKRLCKASCAIFQQDGAAVHFS